MRIKISCLFFVLLAIATGAQAQTELLQSKNCLLCHSLDKAVVGPAYNDVASKYRGDKAAEARLALKIVQGGSGVWGKVAMPANPQVSADEAKILAAFVLSQK